MKTIKTVIKLLFAFSVFYILFSKADIPLIKRLFHKTDLSVFLAAFLLFAASHFISAFRWQVLLRMWLYPVSLWHLSKLYLVGRFFGLFLPTAIGGDIARGYYLYGGGAEKEKTISSILVERIMGFASMMVLALLAMLVGFRMIDNNMIRLSVIVPSIVGLLTLYIFYSRQQPIFFTRPHFLGRKIAGLVETTHCIHQYKTRPELLAFAFLLSGLFQVIGILSTYLIALSIGCTVQFIHFLILLPLVWMVSMIPVSINGLGLKEGAFVFLFSSIGMTREVAITISLLSLVQSIALGVLGGFCFLFERQKISL